MVMVFVPMPRIFSRIFCCDPLPNATTDTTEVIPIIIPSMVSKERILCATMALTDIRKASISWSLLKPKRPLKTPEFLTALFTGWVCVSLIISPSLISIIRLALAAICLSWVTIIMVWPSWCSWRRISITFSPLCESSAPVGSSAKMISPPFIRARAILTRCCCPPESWFGLFCHLSLNPSFSNNCLARSKRWLCGMPA